MIRALFAVLTLLGIAGHTLGSGCYNFSYPTYAPTYSSYVAPVKQVVKEYVAPVAAVYAPIPVYTAVYLPPASYVAPTVAVNPNPPQPMTGANGNGQASTDSQAIADIAKNVKAIAEGMQSLDVRVRTLENRLNAMTPGGNTTPAPPVKPNPGPVDPFNPGGTGGGVSGALPGGAGAVRAPDVAKDMLTLVTNKCAKCHDAASSEKLGKGLTLIKQGELAPLSEKHKSRLVTTAYKGDMPPPDSKIDKLTDQEVGLIIAYVDSLK